MTDHKQNKDDNHSGYSDAEIEAVIDEFESERCENDAPYWYPRDAARLILDARREKNRRAIECIAVLMNELERAEAENATLREQVEDLTDMQKDDFRHINKLVAENAKLLLALHEVAHATLEPPGFGTAEREKLDRIAENERLRVAFERNPGAPLDALYAALEGRDDEAK